MICGEWVPEKKGEDEGSDWESVARHFHQSRTRDVGEAEGSREARPEKPHGLPGRGGIGKSEAKRGARHSDMTETITATQVKELLAKGLSPASILYHVGLLSAQPEQTPESVAEALNEKRHWVTTKLTRIEKVGGLEVVRLLIGTRCDSVPEMKALEELRRIAPESNYLTAEWWEKALEADREQGFDPKLARREVSARQALKERKAGKMRDDRDNARGTLEGRCAELASDGRRTAFNTFKFVQKVEALLNGALRDSCAEDVRKAQALLDGVTVRLSQAAHIPIKRDSGSKERVAIHSCLS